MSPIWIVVILALCIPILGLIVDSPIGRALGVRLERGTPDPTSLRETMATQQRLQLLESEVDALRGEVARLRDEQEFTARLLGRDTTPPPLPPANE